MASMSADRDDGKPGLQLFKLLNQLAAGYVRDRDIENNTVDARELLKSLNSFGTTVSSDDVKLRGLDDKLAGGDGAGVFTVDDEKTRSEHAWVSLADRVCICATYMLLRRSLERNGSGVNAGGGRFGERRGCGLEELLTSRVVCFAPGDDFMTKCRIAGFVSTALCVQLMSANHLVVAQTGSFSPQQMLDLLARPIPAGSRMGLPASFPTRYQDWTEAQRQAGQQIIIQRCALMYALEGDDPKTRLLPETMTKQEAAELAISVCLPSQMPIGWPERGKYVSSAQRLIAKANSQGAGLHLPENLQGAH